MPVATGKAIWRLATSALCAIALVFAAYAHRAAPSNYPSDIDLAQYTLPDGTIPIICLTGPDGEPLGSGGQGGGCEFCRIAASIALPDAPADFVSCAISPRLDFGLPADDIPVRQAFSINAPPRGPPIGNPRS